MSDFKKRVARGWKEVRGNLAVEVIRIIGGSSVITGILKSISQAIHRTPIDWLLFACLVIFGLLMIGVALWIGGGSNQQPRATNSSPSNPDVVPTTNAAQGIKSPARLKIISANWGVAGINNPDVTPYLLERQCGDCFAQPIVADLFHGFDPVSGNPNKLLTVRYSFDGKEDTITRPEYAWLVLPEDTWLLDNEARATKLAEKYRHEANEANQRVEEISERYQQKTSELGRYAALLSPLQIQTFQLAKELRLFLDGLGAKTSVDKSKYPNTPDGLQDFVRDKLGAERPWLNKLQHGYAAQFSTRVDNIMHRLAAESLRDFTLEHSAKMVYDDSQIMDIAERLQLLAVKLDFPNDRKALRRES